MARYAHLAEDSVRKAAAGVATSIGEDILPERAAARKGARQGMASLVSCAGSQLSVRGEDNRSSTKLIAENLS